MTTEHAILATLVVYKIVLLGIGLAARQRTRDGVDFFLGGRKLGPWVAAISASASSSSAWTLLGVSGAAYAWGLSAVWLFPACVGGFALNWYVVAPAMRRSPEVRNAVTVTDILVGGCTPRWRKSLSLIATTILVISLGTYVASQFDGAGKAFQETFGLSKSWSVIIGATIVLAYTLLGGFWAVSLTDTLQGLVMAAACLILPWIAFSAVGGFSGFSDGVNAITVSNYTSFTHNALGAGGLGFVVGILGIGLGYPGQPHVVNRFMALSEGEASLRNARRIAMTWAVIVYSGMLLLGWCGRILFTELADQEVIFFKAAQSLLSPVVAGVMIAAVLSAIMSTADSQLLVAASAVTHDLGRGRKSQSMLYSRLGVVLLTVVALAVALLVHEKIFSRVLFAWTALGAAFGPALVVTVLRGQRAPAARLAAMLLGFGLSVLFYSLPETRGTWVERLVPIMVSLAIMLLARKHGDTPPGP